MESWEPDHRGMWTILPPKDMPLTVVTMLQATISEAWKWYSGEPDNAQQFWNFLVGNGMANVSRGTSPDSPHEKMLAGNAKLSRVALALLPVDVPRETSGGDDASA